MNKNKLKKISVIGMVISAVIWIASPILLGNIEIFGIYIGEVLLLVLGGVPTAFLQFRLCLTDKEKWVRWVPSAVALAVFAAALVFYIIGDFSSSLLALLLFIAAIAPTAGICLGWLAHGKKLALIPLNILLITYLILNQVPIVSRPLELSDYIAAGYLLAGIYLFVRPVEERGES